MDFGLSKKVAVITGADGGIGKAIARAFLAEDAQVAAIGHQRKRIDETARELSENGGRVEPFVADLTDARSVTHLTQAVLERFGTVHVLVNAAGGVGKFAGFDKLTDEDWHKDIELNLMTAVRATRAFLPAMRKQKWGRVISIASESGVQPDADIPNYNAAKAALIAFGKSISKAYAVDGVLVNSVSPAFIRTPLVDRMLQERADNEGTTFDEALEAFLKTERPHIELHRPGNPAEVAAAVVFLASEQASFILGSNLRVDGGSIATV
ncbi:MAG: SDR family NAD(P)-dependent oxidoreductase [Gammaproteobacteria bacterium]|nr:SDR family NAD(P)-dependent oxidoreductase [Gammaproteobacteria bacterium]